MSDTPISLIDEVKLLIQERNLGGYALDVQSGLFQWQLQKLLDGEMPDIQKSNKFFFYRLSQFLGCERRWLAYVDDRHRDYVARRQQSQPEQLSAWAAAAAAAAARKKERDRIRGRHYRALKKKQVTHGTD